MRAGIVAGILAALLASAGPPAFAQTPAPSREDSRPLLTVTGNGEVLAAPDQAVVNLGAVAQAAEARAAQEQVNRTVQEVIRRIRALGIAEQNIRTSNLFLGPVYGGEEPHREGRYVEPRIVGYRASNTVQVTVDDLERIGDVVDAGLAAGANQLEGIYFRLRNDQAQRQEALQLAVREARAKADAMAGALGVELAGVAHVSEGLVQVYPPQPMMEVGRAMAADMAAPTPVQPGQQQVFASVTVTYVLTAREGMRP